MLSTEELARKEDEVYMKLHGVFYPHGQRLLRDKRSLFIFDRSWAIRKAFVWFVDWCWFDRFITFVILLNSLVLAFTDYQERIEPTYISPINEFFAKVDVVFSSSSFRQHKVNIFWILFAACLPEC